MSGGLPDVLLASFTLTVPGFVSPGTEEFALLDSPLDLSSGVQYALVVEWGGPPVTAFSLGGRRTGVSDPYPGGNWLRYHKNNGWEDIFETGFMNMYFKTYSETRKMILSVPADTDTGITTHPLLQWTISEGGAEEGDLLDIYLRKDDANFTEDDLLAGLVDATANSSLQIVGGLEYNSTYYWQVQAAFSVDGELTSSDVYSFTTLVFAPPTVSVDGGGNPTGLNNMITLKRLVAASNNKIYYET